MSSFPGEFNVEEKAERHSNCRARGSTTPVWISKPTQKQLSELLPTTVSHLTETPKTFSDTEAC